MAEPITPVVALIIDLCSIPYKLFRNTASSLIFLTSQYGSAAGIVLWSFGSQEVWQLQLQVLRSHRDADAMDFKKSVQEDSSIVAVAVSKICTATQVR
jgi:hypothetical protein